MMKAPLKKFLAVLLAGVAVFLNFTSYGAITSSALGEQLAIGAGSVSSPAIWMGGDTTTGIYRPAANQVGISISGSQVMNVTSSGVTITGTISGSGVAGSQPAGNFRNLLDNGRFDLYQRGTTAVTSVNTTATYHADRWAGYANTGGASVTLTNITATLPTGFANAEQVQRANANASVQPIFLVQEIPTSDVIAAQGQTVCLQAQLKAGANYSAAGSVITAQVITGTGTDQGLSSLLSASWTGQATTLNDSSQVLTTSFQRFAPSAWCFTMPSTATEAAVQFGFTPVGTAGANDWFQITGAQFEINSAQTPFENRQIGVETVKAQRYFWQLTEANTPLPATCYVTGGNTQACFIQNPVVMRAAPTAGITAGGFQVVIDGAAATAVVSMAAATGNVNSCNFTLGNTATAAVHAVNFRGSGTTGKVTCTADF